MFWKDNLSFRSKLNLHKQRIRAIWATTPSHYLFTAIIRIMKFAILNDMHIGPLDSGFAKGVQRKLIHRSEELIKSFVKDMNNNVKPEFVVVLGDLIEDVNNKEIDLESFKKAANLLKPLTMPYHVLVGNHDVRTISQQEIARLFNYDKMYYSFDSDDFHLVALSFEMTGEHTTDLTDIRAEVPVKQIDWLKKDLASSDKPTIVFIHYGLAEDDMKGNFWFEGEIKHAVINNRIAVRDILEESDKVKAVFSAHQHWNRMNIHNKTPYFTVTSLVENFNNDGLAAEAYTIVKIDKERVSVEVRGNDPAQFSYSYD